MKKSISLLVILLFILPCFSIGEEFQFGTGIYDVTGPAADVTMAGYANLGMKTGGLHMRLRSRAFVVEASGRRVAFVCADLWAITQGVKLKVVERLQQEFGDTYTVQNVMLNATHTHSGPGGYAWYTLYNTYVLGFSKENFDAIVEGIAQSIIRAHNNLAPGKIFMAEGNLENASHNRSLEAFQANRDAHLYDSLDRKMTVLKFVRPSGKAVGMLSWFGVHTTSVFYGNMFQGDPSSAMNRMISGDNKGWAERKFEAWQGTDYNTADETFIAAFANTTLGDSSPNILGNQNGGGINDYASCAISGQKQFAKAKELYLEADRELKPHVDFRHNFTDYSNVLVSKEFTDGIRDYSTSYAALGIGFTTGAEDGPSHVPFIGEGWYQGKYDKTHGSKIIFLETGKLRPAPWTPEVLPTQIFVIGNLAVLGVPAEFTTHAGRRIKQTVQNDLAQVGVDTMIVCAPTNTFSNYVTTREEYNEQHYEGGSTLFGQWTLGAYRQTFKMLSNSLAAGTIPPAGPMPRDLSDQKIILPTNSYDEVPSGKNFGDIHEDAPSSVERMSVMSAVFWGGHLQNTYQTNDSFFVIQRKVKNGWEDVRHDYDLDTGLLWNKHENAASHIRVIWDVPADVTPGTYRIVHNGAYKTAGSIKSQSYQGTSREFTVKLSKNLRITNCYIDGQTMHFRMEYPGASPFDLVHKEKYVANGAINFVINGTEKFVALPSKRGVGYFEAQLPSSLNVESIEVPAGHAYDAYGNNNIEYSTRSINR